MARGEDDVIRNSLRLAAPATDTSDSRQTATKSSSLLPVATITFFVVGKTAGVHSIYSVVQKTSPLFISLWFPQTLTNFYNIWHIIYRVNLQRNSYWFTRLTYVLLLYYLEKQVINCKQNCLNYAYIRLINTCLSMNQSVRSDFLSEQIKSWNANSALLYDIKSWVLTLHVHIETAEYT